jgi:hypothetical protein
MEWINLIVVICCGLSLYGLGIATERHLHKKSLRKKAKRIHEGFARLTEPAGDVKEYYCEDCHIKVWTSQGRCWNCGKVFD